MRDIGYGYTNTMAAPPPPDPLHPISWQDRGPKVTMKPRIPLDKERIYGQSSDPSSIYLGNRDSQWRRIADSGSDIALDSSLRCKVDLLEELRRD